jgi:hypothetical protein
MDNKLQEVVFRLGFIDSKNPHLVKLQKLQILVESMQNDGWLISSRKSNLEDLRGIDDVILRTDPESPNVLVYAIIWVGTLEN